MLEKKDLQAIAQLIDTSLDTRLAPVNDRLDRMDGRLDQMDDRLDRMDDRLDQMDKRIDQMQDDISDLRTTVTRVAVTQENVVISQLKLLAEGHETLLNTLARKDRVEALEDDVALLKTALKAMSLRVAELEKAQ